MSYTTVNEGSTAYLTVTFKDKAGALAVPSTVTWEAVDLKTGTVMQAPTALTPAGTIEITLKPAVNAILDDTLEEEVRRIIVKATYAVDDAVNAQYDYKVANLSQVT